MSIDIHKEYAEPCECPVGQCAHFVGDDAHCINRLTGDVRTQLCLQCGPGYTWYQNGECLKCRRKESP